TVAAHRQGPLLAASCRRLLELLAALVEDRDARARREPGRRRGAADPRRAAARERDLAGEVPGDVGHGWSSLAADSGEAPEVSRRWPTTTAGPEAARAAAVARGVRAPSRRRSPRPSWQSVPAPRSAESVRRPRRSRGGSPQSRH